nr:reverse transcriptase domain-containing protein [Tanacetum cinerariifolium]
QRIEKHFRPIHYAIKTMNQTEANYMTTEKEMLAVVYAFEKFRSYLIINKSIVYTDHSALKILSAIEELTSVMTNSQESWQSTELPIDSGPTGGHYGANYTAKKVFDSAYHPQTSGQVEVTNHGLKRILERMAYENSLIYKERTKKLHDDKIKNRIFNVGDQVLLFNSRLKIFSGKLKSRWSGTFTISKIYPYGTAKLIHQDGCNFKVNCHRLKHYHGGDPSPLEIPDVHTFPKDN